MAPSTSKGTNKVVTLDPDHHRSLIHQFTGGDSDALCKLFEIYHPIVYSYLSRCGLEGSELKQSYADVFTTVTAEAAQYEEALPVKLWILQIAVQAVRIVYRTKRVKELVFSETAQLKLDELKALTVDSPSNDSSNWLELAIKELRLSLREVLLLSFSEHTSEKQMAQVLDLDDVAVKHLLQEARFTLVGALTRKNSRLNWESILTTSPCFRMREVLISGGPETLQKNVSSQEHLILCDDCFAFLEAIAEVDSGLQQLPVVDCDDELLTKMLAATRQEPQPTEEYREFERDYQELTGDDSESKNRETGNKTGPSVLRRLFDLLHKP